MGAGQPTGATGGIRWFPGRPPARELVVAGADTGSPHGQSVELIFRFFMIAWFWS